MKLATSFINFARGQGDRNLNARFDLPIYSSSSEIVKNFKTNFQGNLLYRQGWERMISFQDCAFIEFKFKIDQNYIVVAYANMFRFLTYASDGTFGWVLDSGSSILEVATPYSLAEAKQIARREQYTQNDDAMQITIAGHKPRSLRRVAADEFELVVTSLKDDPFGLTYDATKVVTGITNASEAVVTIVGHSYIVDDSFKLAAVGGMVEIDDYTVGVIEVVDVDNVKVSLDTSDTDLFTAYTSGGTAARVDTFGAPNLCRYHGAKLYYAATAAKITTIWGSEDSAYDVFSLPETVVATTALQFTLAEISEEILWLFAGENSLIVGSSDGIIAVNGGEVGKAITAETIDATLTNATPSGDTFPIAKDGLIFYMDTVKRRCLFFSYDLLTEKFQAKDATKLSYEVTKGGVEKMRHKLDQDDFIYCQNGLSTLQTVTFDEGESIVGWHNHNRNGGFLDIAQITDNVGAAQMFCLTLREGTYYIEREAEYVEFSKPEDFLGTNAEDDDAAYYRMRAEELKSCIYTDHAQLFSNLQDNLITYDSGAGTVTDTDGVFVAGDVGKHIVYQTQTGYESGRFEITVVNSANEVDVTVLQTPTASTFQNWYLSFDELSGLGAYEGETLSVVADGAYIGDFVVSSGVLALGKEVTSVVFGDKYTGTVKTFSLGVVIKQYNTYVTDKVLSRLALRVTTSLGGKFGTSFYKLKPIQELKQGDINYLPSRPLDDTVDLPFLDFHEIDKHLYIVQDLPLPFFATGVIIEADHSLR